MGKLLNGIRIYRGESEIRVAIGDGEKALTAVLTPSQAVKVGATLMMEGNRLSPHQLAVPVEIDHEATAKANEAGCDILLLKG